MHTSKTSSLPSGQPWRSQTLQPGTPATDPLPENAGNDEAQIQPPRTPIEIAVRRLPAEVWIAVCEALRRLDSIAVINKRNSREREYKELQRMTINKNRPDPIINAVSILPLSQTCRYLHEVTSPSLLETIRITSPTVGDGQSRYRSVMRQVKSVQLNSYQRLQHVRGFAIVSSYVLKDEHANYESDLRNQIYYLLVHFPNLRHLTVIGMELDGPLMQSILTLPLEHLWLWGVEPKIPTTVHPFTPTTTPRINLRSLVLEESWSDFPSIPINWISQLIGTAMQDLSIEPNELVAPVLPVLPDLEFLEVPADFRTYIIKPSLLYGLLSKTPDLKVVAIEVEAAMGDPADTVPALPHLERLVCHASWLPALLPKRPIKTVKVLCDYQVRVRELFEILHKGSVPLRDLTLYYIAERLQTTWSPDDLEPVSRYLPELEILRLRTHDHKMDGLQQGLLYISQLQKLRIISFSTSDHPNKVDSSRSLDDVWQESNLREFLNLTRSPILERVGFVEECEWILEATGVWILWRGGRMVRSVSL